MADYEMEETDQDSEAEDKPVPARKKAKKEKIEYKLIGIDFDDHAKVLTLLTNAQSADSDMREQARESTLFVTKRDGQWEPTWWNNASGKPRYTFDLTTPIINQICGEIDGADFDIVVSPGGGSATKDVAETLDGMVRNIENFSRAKHIYGSASRGMVTAGLDGWRVSTRYIDDDSFDQDLMIEPIPNYIDRVWFDPSSELQDKSDSRYAFVLHPVSVEEYEQRWPEGSKMGVSDGLDGEAYYDKAETILVGELLYAEYEDRELVLMSNGQVYKVDEKFESVADELLAMGITEKRRRMRKERKICSRFFDNSGWLEDDKDTVFSMIPVVPLYGNYKVVENKVIYCGAVDKLIDPQRVLNYSMSREIEEGALAPRAKYWMTLEQAAGHEDTLATLNTNADPVQFYNNDPTIPGSPQQQGGAQINPGLRNISEAMRGMINYAAGMFAANMGDNPNAQSGKAINSLQDKGDNGTRHYFKSLEIAIAHTGRLLVNGIPKTYDTERMVRIIYEDNSDDMATVNQTVVDQQTGQPVTLNDLSHGRYDVVCSAGPSFKNRQQETLQAIIEFAKIDPSIIQLGGDILLSNVSTPAAKQLAQRKRAQMIQQGLIPQDQMTDEELQAAQQAQQAQQQPPADPNMVLAQAEQMKAQALMMDAQTKARAQQLEMMKLQQAAQQAGDEAMIAQLDIALQQGANQIKAYDSETKRMDTEIKAQQAGAKINLDSSKAQGQQIDNQIKIAELQNPFANLSDEELIRIAQGG